MRIGVIILPEDPWARARAMWMSLEERGFAHAWIYDHLAWRALADSPWYATMPTLAAAALATERIQLGTWVTSPNFRHPVTLAKDLLTLDDMSGGRVLAGMGAGGIGWDSAVFGGPDLSPRQRVDRFAEFVELTDLLLRQPDTSFDGEWYTAVRARMVPAGSRSRIPLLVAANGPRGMRIASGADGWITSGAGPADTWDEWWSGVAGLVSRFEQVLAPADEPRPFRRMLSADAGPTFALESLDAFTEAAGRAAELGFTDMVVHWPRADGPYRGDERLLDAVAGLLTDGEYLPS